MSLAKAKRFTNDVFETNVEALRKGVVFASLQEKQKIKTRSLFSKFGSELFHPPAEQRVIIKKHVRNVRGDRVYFNKSITCSFCLQLKKVVVS